MKIEMNKKYKTRNGENVTIHRIAFNKAYGVIECAYKDGLFTVWDMGGELIESEMNGLYDGSLDLVEAKEDWEVLIEKCKYKDTFIVANWEICLVHEADSIDDDDPYDDGIECGNNYFDYVKIYCRGEYRAIKKDSFRFATKKEVIEYFFGDDK